MYLIIKPCPHWEKIRRKITFSLLKKIVKKESNYYFIFPLFFLKQHIFIFFSLKNHFQTLPLSDKNKSFFCAFGFCWIRAVGGGGSNGGGGTRAGGDDGPHVTRWYNQTADGSPINQARETSATIWNWDQAALCCFRRYLRSTAQFDWTWSTHKNLQ